MNILQIACTLFESINKLDECQVFKDYYEKDNVYYIYNQDSIYNIVSASFFTKLYNDLKFFFLSRVRTSKSLDPMVLELLKSIKVYLKLLLEINEQSTCFS